MKLFTHLSLVFFTVLLTACGGGTSPQSEMTSLMGDMTKVLESITDEGSAKSAKSKLEPLAERMAKLTEEIQASDQKPESISADEAKELGKVTQKFAQEYARVMAIPEVGASMAEIMSKIGQ